MKDKLMSLWLVPLLCMVCGCDRPASKSTGPSVNPESAIEAVPDEMWVKTGAPEASAGEREVHFQFLAPKDWEVIVADPFGVLVTGPIGDSGGTGQIDMYAWPDEVEGVELEKTCKMFMDANHAREISRRKVEHQLGSATRIDWEASLFNTTEHGVYFMLHSEEHRYNWLIGSVTGEESTPFCERAFESLKVQ